MSVMSDGVGRGVGLRVFIVIEFYEIDLGC